MFSASFVLTTALLAIDPEAAAAAERGAAAINAGDFDTAVFHLDDAIRREPFEFLYYAMRGSAHFAKQRYEKALHDFTEAHRLEPTDERLLMDGGLCRWRLGRLKEAKEDFERALKLKPESDKVLGEFAWALATMPQDDLRDGKRALELATKACKLTNFKNPYYVSTLAAAHAETGDFDEAVRRLREAMALPDFPKNRMARTEKRLKLYSEKKPYRETFEDLK